MKSIVAILISVFLCVQPAYAMPVREPILYAETTEEAEIFQEPEIQEGTESGTEEGTDAQGESDGSVETEEQGGTAQQEETAQGGIDVSAPSAVLMEASTGQVIFEKDADTQLPPASVTKVMTLLLIFDALNEGKITLEDQVTTSEYAASMGGSQVFLEPGEVQTIDTMIKCISVASANDACVSLKNSRRKLKPLLLEQVEKRM